MLACRPMLSLALAVMGGVMLGRVYPGLSAFFPWAWIAAPLAVCLFAASRPAPPSPLPSSLPPSYRSHIMPVAGFFASRGLNRFILVACLFAFLLGLARQQAWRNRVVDRPLPESLFFSAVLVADAPAREFDHDDRVWRVPARLVSVAGNDAGDLPVRLLGVAGPDFRRGDLIQARVRLNREWPKSYPTAFDGRFWLERSGLSASLQVVRPRHVDKDAPAYRVIAVDDRSVLTHARRIVDTVRGKAIGLTLARGGEWGGMLAAMLYGYKADLDPEVNNMFRRVGIGHVLAISGLHVGLVVGLLWWLGGWIGWPPRFRALACLALSCIYLGLSGGQVAATRATLMAVIHLGALAWGRKSDMLNSLGAAAFIIVLANPTSPLDVSFQLSFTAVVFIYMGMRGIRPDETARRSVRPQPSGSRPRRMLNELWSLVRLSVATWFGLYPIIAVVFNQVNLVGLPINVLVIPLMATVLAGGLLLPVLGWIPGAAAVLTFPARTLSFLAGIADSLPYSSFAVHAPSGWWMFFFYLFAFLFLLHRMLPSGKARRSWLAVCLAAMTVCLAGITVSMASAPPTSSWRVTLLPGGGVGAMVWEAPDGPIAILGQPRRGGRNEAGWLHYLRRKGSVSLVSLGWRGDITSLSFHYPVVSVAGIRTTDIPAEPLWRRVQGVPGIEYAVVGNDEGRAVALVARSHDTLACSALRLGAGEAERVAEFLAASIEERRCIVSVGFRDDSAARLFSVPDAALVGVTGWKAPLRTAWFGRDEFGAIVLGHSAKGYDGSRWRSLGDGK